MSIHGSCVVAAQVAAGQVNSQTTPEQWHARCKGGHHSRRRIVEGTGKTAVTRIEMYADLCDCECHLGRHACLTCGRLDQELNPVMATCVDEIACHDAYQQRLEADPQWQRLQRFYAEVRAMRKEEQGEAPSRQAAEPRPKTGTCQHCGAPTGGGLFQVGHDAKLKSILTRTVREFKDKPTKKARPEAVAALAELMLRRWVPKDLREDDSADQSQTWKAAEQLIQDNATGAWLESRVQERIAAYQIEEAANG